MKGNEGRSDKPIYKKWWFWVILIIIFGGAGGALDKDKDEAAPAPTEQAVTQPKDEKGGVPEETADATSKQEPATESPDKKAVAVTEAALPEYKVVEERLDKSGIWYLTLESKSTDETELRALVESMRGQALLQKQDVNAIHVGIIEEGSGSNAYTARGKIAMSQKGLAQTGLTDIGTSEFEYQYQPAEAAKKDEPTDKEWEDSYKTIALTEAETYIELTVKGTLSKDRYDSAIGVIEKYAAKVGSKDLAGFQKLADLVAANDLNGVKAQYKALGGEDFPELSKDAAPINF